MSSESAVAQSRGWITWSSLGLGVTGIGQFALLAALARMLGPSDFGVVTAVLVVIGAGRVVHASIGPALVQRAELREDHIRAALLLACATACAMTALVFWIAPGAAWFFRDEALTPVLRAMSLLYVTQMLGIVPEALLQRDMRLKELAIAETLSVVVGLLPVGIALAASGSGAYALVGANLAQAAVKCAAFVWQRPQSLSMRTTRGALRDVSLYSSGVLAAGLFNYAASQGDNAVVGRSMSAAALGIYGRAYQLMSMPAMFLGEVVDRIVFPLLSRVQDDRERLRAAYARGVSLCACVMAPAAAVSIALADEITLVALGPGWSDVAPTFAALCCGLVFRAGYKLSDMLARATGTVYARAWRQAVFAALLLLGALVGSEKGTIGVAVGVVLALFCNYVLMAWLSLSTTGMRWREFASLHVRGLLLAALFGVSAAASAAWLRSIGASSIVVLLLATTASCCAFLAVAIASPSRVLGADGVWLWQTIAGRSRDSQSAAA